MEGRVQVCNQHKRQCGFAWCRARIQPAPGCFAPAPKNEQRIQERIVPTDLTEPQALRECAGIKAAPVGGTSIACSTARLLHSPPTITKWPPSKQRPQRADHRPTHSSKGSPRSATRAGDVRLAALITGRKPSTANACRRTEGTVGHDLSRERPR